MVAESLKRRAPRLASLLSVLNAARIGWRKRGTPEPHDYARRQYEIEAAAPGHDLPVGLFVRAALDGRYDAVAEIGAAAGGRIATVKRLLPNVNAYAFDIGESYRTPFERHGVRFRPFDETAFSLLPQRSLVFSRGTLCYLRDAELREFLRKSAERGHDLVLVEPMPTFDIAETVRRGGGSWYHPYPGLLAGAGYAGHPSRAEGTKHGDSLGMLECWYAAWARAPGSPG